MLATARRELDKILGDFNPDYVEERKKMVSDYNPLCSVIEKYLLLLEDHENYFDALSGIINTTAWPITDVLKPSEITTFYDFAVQNKYEFKDDRDITREYVLGDFTRKLTQNSYDAGYNNFSFHSHSFGLISNLYGSKNNLLVISVDDVGSLDIWGSTYYRGKDCNYVQMTLRGPARCYGTGSSNSVFILEGEDRGCLGWSNFFSEPLDLFEKGEVEKASDCTFIIKGKLGIDSGIYCDHCTFKVYSQEAVEQLLGYIGYHGNNRVILVHPDGREELKRDFHG